MTGLFGYAAAGALEGIGKGLVEQAKATREAAMEELRHKRQLDRDEASRAHAVDMQEAGFQHSEGLQSRSQKFQASENDKSRKHSASENDKNREPDTITNDEGIQLERPKAGGAYKPSVDESGKPVKPRASRKDSALDPADVRTAEWLVQQKIAKDPKEAWDMARQARSNPEETYNRVIKDLRSAESGFTGTEEELLAEARKRVQMIRTLGREDSSAPASAPAEKKTEAPAGKKAAREPVKSTWSIDPRDWDWAGSEKKPPQETAAPRKPPTDYPDARWSDKAGGWVVQKDGKWFKVN
jgi:hypothetical protein